MMGMGLGFLINAMFGRSEEQVAAYKGAIGKTIKSLTLDPEYNDGDGGLIIRFEESDNASTASTADAPPRFYDIVVFDDGRSCCEYRYMHTDDDLTSLSGKGATFLGLEVRDGGEATEDEYGEVHEKTFLHVNTSLGTIVMETHNEHNGYYGGIFLVVKPFGGE